jgi:hypothetical protein
MQGSNPGKAEVCAFWLKCSCTGGYIWSKRRPENHRPLLCPRRALSVGGARSSWHSPAERVRLGRSNSQTLDRVRTSPRFDCIRNRQRIRNRERWTFSACCARDGHSPAERGRPRPQQLSNTRSRENINTRSRENIAKHRLYQNRQRWGFSTCCARDGHSPLAEHGRLRPQQLSNTRSRENINTRSRENIAKRRLYQKSRAYQKSRTLDFLSLLCPRRALSGVKYA